MYMHVGRLQSACTHACMHDITVYISVMVMLADVAKYVYAYECVYVHCVCENTSVCVPHCTCVGGILAGMHKVIVSEWLTRGSLDPSDRE